MDLAKNLKLDNVARLRPTAALMVQPTCPVADAVKLMRQKQVGCLLVCAGRQLAGIFTERDLLVRVFAAGRPLSVTMGEVMTPDPIVVATTDTVRRALLRMEKGGHRHLPVLDEAGRPFGILSVKRLVHYLAEHFAATVYNQPPDSISYPLHSGGA